jgi:hypothetical protein
MPPKRWDILGTPRVLHAKWLANLEGSLDLIPDGFKTSISITDTLMPCGGSSCLVKAVEAWLRKGTANLQWIVNSDLWGMDSFVTPAVWLARCFPRAALGRWCCGSRLRRQAPARQVVWVGAHGFLAGDLNDVRLAQSSIEKPPLYYPGAGWCPLKRNDKSDRRMSHRCQRQRISNRL